MAIAVCNRDTADRGDVGTMTIVAKRRIRRVPRIGDAVTHTRVATKVLSSEHRTG